MTRALGVSPALLFLSRSHLPAVTGAAAAVSAAAHNILLATRHEAIPTGFIHAYGHLHADQTSRSSQEDSSRGAKMAPRR